MADYNFETLNSTDFEHLVRDLLNARLRDEVSDIFFQSFPEGKDKGIDLLDSKSKPGNYKWIVQAKHQPNISFAAFLNQLIKSTKTYRSELEKIKKLAPERYLITTSKSLTLSNREEILDKMKPYICSLTDIIDREELNRLLILYPEIEISHPKLWFSSVYIFERILHNDVHGRSMWILRTIVYH